MNDAVVWTIAAGAVASAILSTIALFRFILGAHAERVRFHDEVMGDGNGRKSLRDVMEQVRTTIVQHTLSDERQFAKIDRILETQDVAAVAAAKALAVTTAATTAAIKEALRDK